MDSGNSGSVQSSSTGTGDNDQEYESRGHDSISAFFNPTTYPSGSFAGFENPQSLQLYSLRFNPGSNSSSPAVFGQHQQVHNSCFGSLDIGPNNFAPISNSNGNNNGLDLVWPNKFGPLRSQSQDAHLHPDLGGSRHNNNNNNNRDLGTAGGAQPSQQPTPGGGPPSGSGRNPKKRSRASRRAPTTVMTTDTSNFRQMVQEFTGIPAPPFSASGFPTRTRLDLFGFGGLGMSSIPRAVSGSSPPYRPFLQKMLSNPLPMVPQAGGSSTSASATNIISSTSTSASGSTTNNIPNFQNYFTFQSLLQPSSTIMDHPGSVHGTTTTTTTTAGPCNGGGRLGSRCETTTDQTSWAAALNHGLGLGRQGDHTRCSVNDGGGSYSSVINVASSENNGGALRAEGMLESWICSSDN